MTSEGGFAQLQARLGHALELNRPDAGVDHVLYEAAAIGRAASRADAFA